MSEVIMSPREREVATLLLCAMPNKEIAKQMGITTSTVKVYLQRLCLRHGMQHVNRVKLVTLLLAEAGK